MRRSTPDVAPPSWTVDAGDPADPQSAERVVERLRPFLSEARVARIEEVIDRRTRWLTVLVDGIHDPHNAAAVLRTCEALGVQDVHVLERGQPFVRSRRVTQGADKWLTLRRHADAETAVRHLRGAGYRLVAADATEGPGPAETLVDLPLALLVGNEHDGLSSTLLRAADARVRMPMLGFSQSVNLSVATAVLVWSLRSRLPPQAALPDDQKMSLRARFYQLSV